MATYKMPPPIRTANPSLVDLFMLSEQTRMIAKAAQSRSMNALYAVPVDQHPTVRI